jgi:O-antigen ligase
VEIVLPIVALAVAVWGAILLGRGGLVSGCLLVMLASSCFGQPFFKLPLGPIPLTIDRALLLLVAGYYVWQRRFGEADPKPLLKADYLLFAFMALLTINTFTHDWKINKSLPMAQLLFLNLLPSLLYWIVRQARLSERAILAVFVSGGLFAIYLCLTAIAETRGLSALVFPRYISSAEFKEFLGRGRGPFLSPTCNGFYQGVCLCAGLMIWPRLTRWQQLALLAVMPIVAWGVYATLTRSVWMGVIVGLTIIVGFGLPRAWRVPVLGSFAVVAVAGIAITWQSFVVFKRDKNLSAQESLESAKLRPILARIAYNMFLDKPLLGCGFGHYEQHNKFFVQDRDSDLNIEKGRQFIQHNVFLSQLTELGLIGMSLWILLLGYWGLEGWRLWRDDAQPLVYRQVGLLMLAMIGVYLPNGMFQDVSAMPAFNTLVLFVAGLTMGLAAKRAASHAAASSQVVDQPSLLREDFAALSHA